jgi:hypothetical protein
MVILSDDFTYFIPRSHLSLDKTLVADMNYLRVFNDEISRNPTVFDTQACYFDEDDLGGMPDNRVIVNWIQGQLTKMRSESATRYDKLPYTDKLQKLYDGLLRRDYRSRLTIARIL